MSNEFTDPNGWLHLIAGGLLAAVGKRVWEVLANKQMVPAKAVEVNGGNGSSRSNLYLAAELDQLRRSIDSLAGTVAGHDARLDRLEPLKRTHSTD